MIGAATVARPASEWVEILASLSHVTLLLLNLGGSILFVRFCCSFLVFPPSAAAPFRKNFAPRGWKWPDKETLGECWREAAIGFLNVVQIIDAKRGLFTPSGRTKKMAQVWLESVNIFHSFSSESVYTVHVVFRKKVTPTVIVVVVGSYTVVCFVWLAYKTGIV